MDLEKEYASRFDWRTGENLGRLQTLFELVGNTGGGNVKLMNETYPQLKWIALDNTAEEALLISLFHAWCEVCECFIFGENQAVILLSRSIAERCIKREYIKKAGALPGNGEWTLGRFVYNKDGVVDQHILDLAKPLLKPGNDRAHALLEITDPEKANFGGDRAIEVAGQGYQIYQYAGEAGFAITQAHQVLKAVCG